MAGWRLQLSTFPRRIIQIFPYYFDSSLNITCFPAYLELGKDTPNVQTLYTLRTIGSSGECSMNVDGQDCFYPE